MNYVALWFAMNFTLEYSSLLAPVHITIIVSFKTIIHRFGWSYVHFQITSYHCHLLINSTVWIEKNVGFLVHIFVIGGIFVFRYIAFWWDYWWTPHLLSMCRLRRETIYAAVDEYAWIGWEQIVNSLIGTDVNLNSSPLDGSIWGKR